MYDTVIDPPSTPTTVGPVPGVALPGPTREAPRRARAANVLLGRKLRTDQEMHERLGNSTALAVFASDALSSVAYATEVMLIVLLGAVGVGLAFSTIVPLSLGIVALLVILVFSYRQTIKAYPSAGGAYIVTRDNFGLLPAQIAGVALLTDYILTVAVSVAAGTAALTSALPSLTSWAVPIAVAFIVIIAFGNLRGVKESGRIFSAPTFFFIGTMVLLLFVGFGRMFFGHLPVQSIHKPGMLPVGHSGGGF